MHCCSVSFAKTGFVVCFVFIFALVCAHDRSKIASRRLDEPRAL